MAKIISFISRKGGTGKTTNAIHLATTLHAQGKKILLVETDPNFTLNTLRQMELEGDGQAPFDIVGSSDETVAKDLEGYSGGTHVHDVIILYSAGKTTDEGIRKLCLSSDMVIVPTSLTQNDLLVTCQTVMDLAPAREFKKNLRICVLPNRIHSSTNFFTVREALKNLDAIILPIAVPQKNLFVNFSTVKNESEYLPVAQAILNHLS